MPSVLPPMPLDTLSSHYSTPTLPNSPQCRGEDFTQFFFDVHHSSADDRHLWVPARNQFSPVPRLSPWLFSLLKFVSGPAHPSSVDIISGVMASF